MLLPVVGSRFRAYWVVLTMGAYMGVLWQLPMGGWVGVRFGDGVAVRAGTRDMCLHRLHRVPPRVVSLWGLRDRRRLFVLRRNGVPDLFVAESNAALLKLHGAAYARFVVNMCSVPVW